MKKTITLLTLFLLVAFALPAQKGQIFQTGSEGPVFSYDVVAGEPRPYYDSGGPENNMRDTQNMTIIQLKPVNADSHITIVFEEMEIGDNDHMRFYAGAIELWNGADEDGEYYYDWPKGVTPILALKGNPANPKFSVVSNSPDGCMSVAFQHNSTAKGWKGMIYCVKNGDPEPSVGGEPGISFTTNKEVGSKITLSVTANGEVSASGLKLPDGQSNLTKDKEVSYEITSQDIRLTGDITKLEVHNNGLQTLNLNKAKNLTSLECSYNQIQALDFSHNALIKRIKCENNQLATLTLTGCSSLDYLDCTGNKLNALDLSTNTSMWSLWCESNQFTSLDVTMCKDLMYFACSGNQLTELNLSKNAELAHIFCSENKISSLDLSTCGKLNTVAVYDNPLESLKLPTATSLEFISIYRTKLSHESLRTIIEGLPSRFDANNTPLDPAGSLTVQVKGEKSPMKVFDKDIKDAEAKNWKLLQYDEDTDEVTNPTYKEEIASNKAWQIVVLKDVLTIKNAPLGKEVTLHGIDGTLYLRNTLTTETTTLDISKIPSGVYVVTIENVSSTIIK